MHVGERSILISKGLECVTVEGLSGRLWVKTRFVSCKPPAESHAKVLLDSSISLLLVPSSVLSSVEQGNINSLLKLASFRHSSMLPIPCNKSFWRDSTLLCLNKEPDDGSASVIRLCWRYIGTGGTPTPRPNHSQGGWGCLFFCHGCVSLHKREARPAPLTRLLSPPGVLGLQRPKHRYASRSVCFHFLRDIGAHAPPPR